jgi:hypothetical protein
MCLAEGDQFAVSNNGSIDEDSTLSACEVAVTKLPLFARLASGVRTRDYSTQAKTCRAIPKSFLIDRLNFLIFASAIFLMFT